jgi:hypothetical protein
MVWIYSLLVKIVPLCNTSQSSRSFAAHLEGRICIITEELAMKFMNTYWW